MSWRKNFYPRVEKIKWDTVNFLQSTKTKIVEMYESPPTRYNYLTFYVVMIKYDNGVLEIEIPSSELKLTDKHHKNKCLLVEESIVGKQTWTFNPILIKE